MANTELFFYHSPFAKKVQHVDSFVVVNRKVFQNNPKSPVMVSLKPTEVSVSPIPRVTVLGEYNKDNGEIRFFTSRCSDKPNEQGNIIKNPDNFSRAKGRSICIERLATGKKLHSVLVLTKEEQLHPGRAFVGKAKEIAGALIGYEVI